MTHGIFLCDIYVSSISSDSFTLFDFFCAIKKLFSHKLNDISREIITRFEILAANLNDMQHVLQ